MNLLSLLLSSRDGVHIRRRNCYSQGSAAERMVLSADLPAQLSAGGSCIHGVAGCRHDTGDPPARGSRAPWRGHPALASRGRPARVPEAPPQAGLIRYTRNEIRSCTPKTENRERQDNVSRRGPGNAEKNGLIRGAIYGRQPHSYPLPVTYPLFLLPFWGAPATIILSGVPVMRQ